jgi:hypothetical protein
MRHRSQQKRLIGRRQIDWPLADRASHLDNDISSVQLVVQQPEPLPLSAAVILNLLRVAARNLRNLSSKSSKPNDGNKAHHNVDNGKPPS